jgi:hypothetical protein
VFFGQFFKLYACLACLALYLRVLAVEEGGLEGQGARDRNRYHENSIVEFEPVNLSDLIKPSFCGRCAEIGQ